MVKKYGKNLRMCIFCSNFAPAFGSLRSVQTAELRGNRVKIPDRPAAVSEKSTQGLKTK